MKKEEIKVAYIVPVYNVNRYLEECLNSLLEIKSAKEVIIVDDRGSEDPYPIIAPFLKEKGFKYIKNEKNLGLGYARNEGLKVVSDDCSHVYFVDSDDFVISHAIDKEVAKFKIGKSYLIKQHYSFSKTTRIISISENSTRSKYPYAVWGSFWSSNIAKKTMFKSRSFEDIPWVVDFISQCDENDVMFSNLCTYSYRERKSSISKTKMSEYDLKEFINAFVVAYESGMYGWSYSKAESVYFAYFKLPRRARKQIELPDFKIGFARKVWMKFAFVMIKISNFQLILNKLSRKDFFE